MDAEAPDTQAAAPLLMDDQALCARYSIGMGKLLELQRREDFPRPVWLGAGTKRHLVASTDAWIASAMRERPPGAYERKASAGRAGGLRRVANQRARQAGGDAGGAA
ncbi:MAG: hypothetical protein ACK51Z_03075 [Pseudomonadota bacterium]